MEYIDCLNVCLENARTPQGKILMEKMRSDVQWYHENFQDDPQRLSGWGHQYFCADDGAFLQFSRTSPRGHRCLSAARCTTLITTTPPGSICTATKR